MTPIRLIPRLVPAWIGGPPPLPPLIHLHPPLDEDARPCEAGILSRCAGCLLLMSPCTATPVDVRAVVQGTWSCHDCRGES